MEKIFILTVLIILALIIIGVSNVGSRGNWQKRDSILWCAVVILSLVLIVFGIIGLLIK